MNFQLLKKSDFISKGEILPRADYYVYSFRQANGRCTSCTMVRAFVSRERSDLSHALFEPQSQSRNIIIANDKHVISLALYMSYE